MSVNIGREHMQPIDRPFRFTLDFCVVWALLAVPAFLLIRHADIGPWYSEMAALILLPLFATFVLYGPVLLARQIIRSGSHGWFVARVLLSIVMFAALLFGGLWLSGRYTEASARHLAFMLSAFATAYLHWRLRHEEGVQEGGVNRSQALRSEKKRTSPEAVSRR